MSAQGEVATPHRSAARARDTTTATASITITTIIIDAGPCRSRTMPDALISARSLWLARSGRAILQGVDIDIAAGEIVTLIGPNGAGKTTLVRVLLGLETPDQGTTLRKAGLVVGYVPQRFEVDRAIPLTVARFVELGRRAEDDEIERVLGRRRRRQARRSPALGALRRRAAAGAARARAHQIARTCWCSTSRCAASTMRARPSSTR